MGQEIRIVGPYYSLICGNNNSSGRIVNMWPFVEGNPTRPLAGIRGAVVSETGISRFSNGNYAGRVISNVTIHVCIDNVLSGSGKRTQGLSEFLPVARVRNQIGAVGVVCFRIQRGPTQSVALRILLQDDRAMARDNYVERYYIGF